MPDEVQVSFDMSCAMCPAYMPTMFATDPRTGEGRALYGSCSAREYTDGCPAAHMHGVPISMNIYARSTHVIDEDGRAVVFADERTTEDV